MLVKRCCLVVALFATVPVFASESDQKATITRLSGDAKLFTNPFLIKKGPGPHIRYRNKFYNVRDAVVGDVVNNKEVVQAGAESTVLLIFPNGDQITVSPGASYELGWTGDGKKPVIEVLSGMIRGQIQSGGPRAGVEVTTKTTTMGVRGTDFAVASWSEQGGSTVTVLRGEVEVKTLEGKSVGKVPAGQSAIVARSPGAVWQPKIEATPKEELIDIQQTTAVPPPAKDQPMTDDVAQKLEKLESAAVTNTLADIKKHDPQQYDAIVAKSGDAKPDLYALQTATVHEVFTEAPAATPEVEETAKLAFIETPPPVAPTLRAPESDSQFGYQATAPMIAFAWSELPATGLYDVQIASDRDFRRLVGAQRVQSPAWSRQLEDGTYYWRTRGVDDSSRGGGWSETRLVAVKAGSPTPALVEPLPGSDVDAPNFRWTRVDGLSEYRVTVSRDPEGKDVVATETTTNDTVTLGALDEGLYYWTVDGVSPDKLYAARSEPGSFTFGGATVEREDESPKGPRPLELSVAMVLGGYTRSVSGPADGERDSGAQTFELRGAYEINERVQVAGVHRQITLNEIEEGKDEGLDESETTLRAAYAWPVGNFRPAARLGYMMNAFQTQNFDFGGASSSATTDKANLNLLMVGGGVTHLLSGSSRWFTNADVNVAGGASGIEVLQMRVMRLEAGYSHEPFSWPVRMTYAFDMSSTTVSYETDLPPFDAETSEQRNGILIRGGWLL